MLAFVELAEGGDHDMGYATDLAAQLGAELNLLAVIDTPAMVALISRHRDAAVRDAAAKAGGAADPAGALARAEAAAARGAGSETLTGTLVRDARGILQELVDGASRRGVAARGHVIVSEEVPEQVLKEAVVQQVDLILLRPTGSKGFLRRFLDRSVEEILNAAPCAVMVAPSK